MSVVPPTAQRALEWITVLAAAGFDYRLSREDGAWVIHLPSDQSSAALGEIDEYEISEALYAAPRPRKPSSAFRFSHEIYTTLWAVVFVGGCFIIFGPAAHGTAAVRAGAADAGLICRGEWWRTVTALTLHADAAHLLGNLFGLVFLGYLVARIMGPGLGWFLVLAAGGAGNAAIAALVSPHHVSVGASTAVFGALGILVGFSGTQMAFLPRHERRVWREELFPLGAGLSLLAMWGANPGTDMAAHLAGFVAGLVLPIPFSVREYHWMKGRVQRVLEWACAAVLVGAWGLAGMAR